MHAMVSARLDLSYAIPMLCRYMSCPGIDHYLVVKCVISYIVRTVNVGDVS